MSVHRLVLAWVLLGLAIGITPVQAAPLNITSGIEVIAAVNALRASHGLPPYAVDAVLMAAAQGQADYLASQEGRVGDGHVGAGGTDADARALALGYPYVDGLDINENWGTLPLDAPIETLVFSGWSDEIHRHTMLHPQGQRAGAGVAVSGNAVIVVLDVAAYWGDGGLTTQPGSGSGVNMQGTPLAAVSQFISPLIKSEPAADGSITHVVQSGQSLWMISHHYEVPIERLKQINRMGESDTIYIGQRILVRPAGVVDATRTAPPPPPSSTPNLPAPTVQAENPVMTPSPSESAKPISDATWFLIFFALLGMGIILVVTGLPRK